MTHHNIEPSPLKSAIHNYAVQANRAYGVVNDEAFCDAYQAARVRHEKDASVQQLTQVFSSLDAVRPAEFTRESGVQNGQDTMLNWYHTLHSRQELEDGSTLGVDVFVITSIARQFNARIGTDETSDLEVYRAVNELTGKGHTGTPPETILDIKRQTTGFSLSGRSFEFPGLHKKLVQEVLEKPSRFVVTAGAKAHLPEAPVEPLPIARDAQLHIVNQAIQWLDPNGKTRGTEDARNKITAAGATANADNVAAYYTHMFGYGCLENGQALPEWLQGVDPLPFSTLDFRQFREDMQHSMQLIMELGLEANLVGSNDIPESLIKTHQRSIARNSKRHDSNR